MFVRKFCFLTTTAFLRILFLSALIAMSSCSSQVHLPGGKPRKGNCDCRNLVMTAEPKANG